MFGAEGCDIKRPVPCRIGEEFLFKEAGAQLEGADDLAYQARIATWRPRCARQPVAAFFSQNLFAGRREPEDRGPDRQQRRALETCSN